MQENESIDRSNPTPQGYAYGIYMMNPEYPYYPQHNNWVAWDKLFVGQIPKTMNESDVASIFSSQFRINRVQIIVDYQTQARKGCAFVFVDKGLSEQVIAAFHNKYKCEGMTNPIQVRYANKGVKKSDNRFHNTTNTPESPANPPPMVNPMFYGNTVYPQGVYYPGYYPYMVLPPPYVKKEDTIAEDTTTESADTHPSESMTYAPVAPFFYPYGYGGYYVPAYPVEANGMPDPAGSMTGSMTGSVTGSVTGSMTGSMTGSVDPENAASSNAPSSHNDGPAEAKLFVYNIPSTYTENDLKKMFITYGTVVSTKIIRDRESGTSKGYGFVNYEDVKDASKAIKALNKTRVGGKVLTVQIKK